MDRKNKPINATLAELIAMTTEAMKLRYEQQQLKAVPPDPIDCVALLGIIQAAQRLYAENCPGP